ncbi:low molecular weight phosphotyrosine protein phosphatase 1-like [Agrilus planipennis]|uniref:Low molecular weight phosphotyrosine protein phosphatase n=1 Tax=Agrilus planipennis TaxID=224129 RepID=A0A7F5RE00_AGRPL|nr:low molecular weight phosphotyrosine protein phosphatase 1-like [Agrilus planipennis]
MSSERKVLFVCLGNICRSPIAEAVFCNLIEKNDVKDKWAVDSAAIGSWHVGKSPDRRALTVLQKYQIKYNGRARQVAVNDYHEYDFIFGMDDENIDDLKRRAPNNPKAQILLLGDFHPEGDRIIRDPYYDSDIKGFEKCYEQCVRCCEEFLKQYS